MASMGPRRTAEEQVRAQVRYPHARACQLPRTLGSRDPWLTVTETSSFSLLVPLQSKVPGPHILFSRLDVMPSMSCWGSPPQDSAPASGE